MLKVRSSLIGTIALGLLCLSPLSKQLHGQLESPSKVEPSSQLNATTYDPLKVDASQSVETILFEFAYTPRLVCCGAARRLAKAALYRSRFTCLRTNELLSSYSVMDGRLARGIQTWRRALGATRIHCGLSATSRQRRQCLARQGDGTAHGIGARSSQCTESDTENGRRQSGH